MATAGRGRRTVDMIEPERLARRVVELSRTTLRRLREFLVRPKPLKVQLTALALASALPIAAFAGLLILQLEARERHQYEERLLQTAASLAGDLDRQLAAMLAMLKALSTSILLERDSFADFHRQSRQAITGTTHAVILAEPDGTQLLNTRAEYGSPLPKIADGETLKRVSASLTPQVSNLFMGNVSRRPQLNIHIPIVRDEKLRYVLVLAFDPEVLRDIVLQQYLPAGWTTGLSDGNNRIVTRSHQHDRFINTALPPDLAANRLRPDVFPAKRVDGTPVLRAVRQLQTADWVVAATVERDIVVRATRRASTMLLLAGLALVGLVALVATMLSRVLNRELRDLAGAASRLEQGLPVTATDGLVTEINAVKHHVAAAAARRAAHERERDILVRELNHRVKNSFAVLQSILNATLRTTGDPAAFAEAFKGRLHSMAAAQDILTSRDWHSAELDALARSQLAAYLGGPSQRIAISGPRTELPPTAAVPLGLILHELGTNAAKYGALSVPAGRVDLSWSVSERTASSPARLTLSWRESGGPPVTAPPRRGFGSTLIERGMPNAKVERRFEASGVVCTVVVDLGDASPDSAHQEGAAPGT